MPKIIELSGDVGWEITAKGLKNRLPKDESEVLLKVDSFGGSVYEGNRLYNTILDYPGEIKVQFGAIAASAASYFPMAVGKENITVRANSVFMAHRSWSFAIGDADFMQTEADILNGFDKMIASAYSKVTGKDTIGLLSEMKDEIWLMGGQAIVDAGFASAVDDESEIDTNDDTDQSSTEPMDKAVALAKIQTVKARLKQGELEEDLEKWAAKIRNEIEPKENNVQNELFNIESVPHSTGGNKTVEADMTFDEYLEKNPDAKAEFEKRIETAKAEGIKEAVNEDRERFTKVIALSGAAIPENILNAAKEGQTVEAFAIKELETRNDAIKNAKAEDMGKLESKKQTPEKPEGEEVSAAQKKMDAAVDKIVGKDKEAK